MKLYSIILSAIGLFAIALIVHEVLVMTGNRFGILTKRVFPTSSISWLQIAAILVAFAVLGTSSYFYLILYLPNYPLPLYLPTYLGV